MSPVIEKPNNLIDRLHTSQILVGLDLGTKTIGVAVSDKLKIIASPITTIERRGIKKDLLRLKEVLNEYDIGGFVMGLPINLDNTETIATVDFKTRLRYNIPKEIFVKFFAVKSSVKKEHFITILARYIKICPSTERSLIL